MSVLRLTLVSTALLALSAPAGATTFSLAGYTGDAPTFSITSGSLTATYSSPAGNGFAVQDTTGLLSFDTALLDNNFFGTDPLTITFSVPVVGTLSIPFAVLDAFAITDSLTLTTNTGQTATFTGVPDSLSLGEPEGIASLALVDPTSAVTLTGTNAFAVGDVTATAATPEPASLALVASGLAGAAALCRRRRLA